MKLFSIINLDLLDEISNVSNNQGSLCTNSEIQKQCPTASSKLQQKSAFAASIAKSYFIPGITGRARCLEDCHPQSVKSSKSLNWKRRSPPKMMNKQYSVSSFNEWEVEFPSRVLKPNQQVKVLWAETASFLCKAEEEKDVSRYTTTLSHDLESSPRSTRTETTDSITQSVSTGRTSISNVQRCNEGHYFSDHDTEKEQLSVGSSDNRPFTYIRNRWSEYQHDDDSSSRQCVLQDELKSIQVLLRKQRERLIAHGPLEENRSITQSFGAHHHVTHQHFPVRSLSTRSCHRKVSFLANESQLGVIPETSGKLGKPPTTPARASSTRSFRQHERECRRRNSNASVAGPPLVVGIRLPTHGKQLTRAPSA